MWNCFDNFYIKSLVGTSRENPNSQRIPTEWKDVTEADLRTAKEQLARFNAVVITEWLDADETQDYLSKHIFRLNQTIPIEHTDRLYIDDHWRFTPAQWAQV